MTSPTTTTTTTTTPSSAATLTTPAGYTSRFVAHVDHGQTHQASSNSSNPHDRNRFRTFSDEHDEPSTDRVEDYEIAAKNAENDIDGSMVKPQSSKRTHGTDDSTDTDKTITSSSSSYATRPESLQGSGYDNRVENRSDVHEDAFMGGRSVNDVSSSLADRRGSVTDVRVQDEEYRTQAGNLSSSTGLLEESRERSVRPSDEERKSRNGSRYDSETDSDSGTESASETDEEEDQSRDENSNVKIKKTENPDKGEHNGRTSGNEAASNEDESEGSTGSESDDDETTVLSVRSNQPTESNYIAVDRYDDTAKRRSSSITGEKSIEELFDDNGWVITEQDLQPEGPQRISASLKAIDHDVPDVSTNGSGKPSLSEHKQERSRKFGNTESANEADHSEENNDEDEGDYETESGKAPSMSESSDNSPRNREHRQGSIGKNGWLVSDESDNESDRVASPTRKSKGREASEVKADVAARNAKPAGKTSSVGNVETRRTNSDGSSSMVSSAKSNGGPRRKDSLVTDNAWSIDENGWVILNKVNDAAVGVGKVVEGESTGETSTIRSQTTDRVVRTNVENGALVANATRSIQRDRQFQRARRHAWC